MVVRVLPNEIDCGRVMLAAITLDDSQDLSELVDRERERLGRWLSWVSSYRSVEDVRERRRTNIRKRKEGSLFDYAISIPGTERTRTIIGACVEYPAITGMVQQS